MAVLAVGVTAFGFRYLTIRDFANDHYMYLAWAQQLLWGELPGRDFVDPGMPLTYALSALMQVIIPGPFGETLLTIGLLSLSASLVCLVSARMTGSLAAGIAAALFAIALQPRLYNYPKVLVPAATLFLLQHYLAAPSQVRLVPLATWTVAAALFRYDLGVYVAAAVAVALAAAHAREPRRLLRAGTGYAAATALVFLPYALFVQWSVGLAQHVDEMIEFARSDQHQLAFAWPQIPALDRLTSGGETEAAAALFYASNALLATAVPLLVVRARSLGARLPACAAGIVLLACYMVFILRHPLVARVPDMASVLAIAGAWTVAESARMAAAAAAGSHVVRALSAASTLLLALALATVAGVSAWELGAVGERLRETRVADGWAKVVERAVVVKERGSIWPWEGYWPIGSLSPAISYLNECTEPSDRVLLTWPAPEYYYFAQRPFAAGHALLMPPRAFAGEQHQRRMIERLERQSVPVVLINGDRHEEFARTFPLLEEYIQEHYVPGGSFQIYDGAQITVAVRRDLRNSPPYGAEGWPCATKASLASAAESDGDSPTTDFEHAP